MVKIDLNCHDLADPEKQYHPRFVLVEKQHFEGRQILVDNHRYTECKFDDCIFLYSGGPFGFSECTIGGQSRLQLTGSGHRVEEILQPFLELAAERPM